MKRSSSTKKRARSITNEKIIKDISPKTFSNFYAKGLYKDPKKSYSNLNLYSLNERQSGKQQKNNYMEFEPKKLEETKGGTYMTKNLFNNDANSKIIKAKRKRIGNGTALPVKKDTVKDNLKSILNPNNYKDISAGPADKDFYLPFRKKNSMNNQNSLQNNSSALQDRKQRNQSFNTKEQVGINNIFERPFSREKGGSSNNIISGSRGIGSENSNQGKYRVNTPLGQPQKGSSILNNYYFTRKRYPATGQSSTGNKLGSNVESNAEFSSQLNRLKNNNNSNNFSGNLSMPYNNKLNSSNDGNENIHDNKRNANNLSNGKNGIFGISASNQSLNLRYSPQSGGIPNLMRKNVSVGSLHNKERESPSYGLKNRKNKNSKSLNVTRDNDESFNQKKSNIQKLKSGTPENSKDQLDNSKNRIDVSFIDSALTYAVRTRQGFSPHMLKKQNQDAYFIRTKFLGNDNIHLFGVCDGHGVYGELVSRFVVENLPVFLEESLLANRTNNNKQPVEELLFLAVDKTVKKLLRSKIDALFSGTTCNFCLVYEGHLYVTNIGDSRSVIGYVETGTFKSKPLSFDHKPNIPSEKQRIIRNNGRISPMVGMNGRYVGPDRVWLKEEDVPGLAMSRSIGDLVAASVGVTWKPEIAIYRLSPDDRFIVLGSDGIWEVLSNEQVVGMTKNYYLNGRIESACDQLMKETVNRWTKESIIDDITFIVVFLNKNTRNSPSGGDKVDKQLIKTYFAQKIISHKMKKIEED